MSDANVFVSRCVVRQLLNNGFNEQTIKLFYQEMFSTGHSRLKPRLNS